MRGGKRDERGGEGQVGREGGGTEARRQGWREGERGRRETVEGEREAARERGSEFVKIKVFNCIQSI